MKNKIDWKNMENIDYPFLNLLGKQSQLNKYIRGRTKKIDEIDKQIIKLQKQKNDHKNQIMIWNGELKKVNKVIEQTTKITKSDESITLYKEDKIVRGSVRLYGKKKWIHIGSKHKKGLLHTDKLIGDMGDDELCGEFRHKLGITVGKGKTRFFSDSYMDKRRKRKKEELELKKEYRKKVKSDKQSVYTGKTLRSTTKKKK